MCGQEPGTRILKTLGVIVTTVFKGAREDKESPHECLPVLRAECLVSPGNSRTDFSNRCCSKAQGCEDEIRVGDSQTLTTVS